MHQNVREGHEWRHWMDNYNEGLGLVYERLVLNDYLRMLVGRFGVRHVLEVPLYGMAGVSGINSVALAQRGCVVTLVDWNAERLALVRRVWQELELDSHLTLVHVPDLTCLPFANRRFDLVWNWAALWHVSDPAGLLREMARVTRRLVFTAMPNRWQPGYLLRKYVLDRPFFARVDERWTAIGRAQRELEAAGLRLVERGVMDIPPWPDTVMPATEVLRRLGLGHERLLRRFREDGGWHWSTMDYYLGHQPDLYTAVERYMFLERAPCPGG
ncbi:MAG: class I SAM-dependent methyltransferase [Ardenticatenia bacterium]|nr:class I SAM-dependent methyltransferase [Ardenticatenia bacterium]